MEIRKTMIPCSSKGTPVAGYTEREYIFSKSNSIISAM